MPIVCLGCKVNQAESAWLREKQRACPQLYDITTTAVLLTCAVTANASRQSRQMARRMLKIHERVIVSGCDTQLDPQAYHAMGAQVLPRAYLSYLAREPVQDLPMWHPGQPMPAPQSGPWVMGWRKPGEKHTRAQLKVQDGCDANCAYCIVPFTRGLPRSLPLSQAVQAFARLGQSGAREVVLSGIHLGRYSDGQHDLPALLQALLAAHGAARIRLSSLEAMELSPRLLRLMADNPRLCPHLHLPLQTGSDKLLSAMNRSYSASQYARQVERAAVAIPGLCLGADVLVGLPGEDETAFEQTFSLLSGLPLSYLHVFPYSPRPGTGAALMPGRPDSETVRGRAAALRRLGHSNWLKYLKKQIGVKLDVLAENNLMGRACNYCLVKLPHTGQRGELLSMRITGIVNQAQPHLEGEPA